MSLSAMASVIRGKVETIYGAELQKLAKGVRLKPDDPTLRELELGMLLRVENLCVFMSGPFRRAAEQAGWHPATVDTRISMLKETVLSAIYWSQRYRYVPVFCPGGGYRQELHRVELPPGDSWEQHQEPLRKRLRELFGKEELTDQSHHMFGDVQTALNAVLELAEADPAPAPASTQPQEDAPPVGHAGAATPPDEYVTLDQAAARVNHDKKTLERRLGNPKSGMPQPDVEGGGGKAHEWRWSKLRPWLEKEFGRILPKHYPGDADRH